MVMEIDMITAGAIYVLYQIGIGLLIWNIVTFGLYGLDKYRAKKNQWRVKEGTLLTVAFLMGGIGSFLGMLFFRHKTQKLKFKLLVPLAIVANIAVVYITLTV